MIGQLKYINSCWKEGMENINKRFNDMATMTNNVNYFAGEPEEDINIWIRDMMILGEVAEYSEKDLVKAFVWKMKGTALSWVSQVLGGEIGTIGLQELISMMKKRFGSNKNNDITLSRFLERPTPETREEYSKMLYEATIIFERHLINFPALCQMVINKSPIEIKTILFQAASNVETWEDFIQRAEEMAWIPYPDKILSRVEVRPDRTIKNNGNYGRGLYNNNDFGRGPNNKGNYGRGPNNSGNYGRALNNRKYCMLHGEGSHYTKECLRLTEMLENERKRISTKKVNTNEEQIEKDNYDLDNKDSFN